MSCRQWEEEPSCVSEDPLIGVRRAAQSCPLEMQNNASVSNFSARDRRAQELAARFTTPAVVSDGRVLATTVWQVAQVRYFKFYRG
jgi:hypothetical protein